MFDDLNEDNFLVYAIKSYNSTNCVLSEFEEDLKRIKYIKRLIRRYRETDELKERLILNHIIVLSNVFGTVPAVRMLFYKLSEDDYHILKPFLMFLNYLPSTVQSIHGNKIVTSNIPMNFEVAKRLKAAV